MRLSLPILDFGGDQRLSASKIFALAAPDNNFELAVSDQRLSASKIFALFEMTRMRRFINK